MHNFLKGTSTTIALSGALFLLMPNQSPAQRGPIGRDFTTARGVSTGTRSQAGGVVQVQKVTGQAYGRLPDGTRVLIGEGDSLPEGSTIETGPGASVDVFMGRNLGVLRVAGNTTLRFENLGSIETGSERVSETRLVLEKGEVFGHVNRQTKGSTYQLVLPDGVLDVGESRFQAVHRPTETLTELNGLQVAQGSLQSTIRVLSGTGTFSQGGAEHVFDGPGEYNPGAPSITPLAPEAQQLIAQVFTTLSGDSRTAQNNNPTENLVPQQLLQERTLLVQQQDIPMSPTQGGGQ